MWLEIPTQDTCKFLGSWKGSCVFVFVFFFIVIAGTYTVLENISGNCRLLLLLSQSVCGFGQGSSLRAGTFWGNCFRACVWNQNSCHFMCVSGSQHLELRQYLSQNFIVDPGCELWPCWRTGHVGMWWSQGPGINNILFWRKQSLLLLLLLSLFFPLHLCLSALIFLVLILARTWMSLNCVCVHQFCVTLFRQPCRSFLSFLSSLFSQECLWYLMPV